MSRDTSDSSGPIVSSSGIIAAGLASAGAATVTSRFGVAGTLLGAALTTMIITGGAAILKAYLENATGKVRGVSGRLRARKEQRKVRHYSEPAKVPDRPDLRNNPVGRMRAALGWFSRLPNLRRRSILIKGLIAAVVAFVIGLAVIYGAERLIGNSFSCGFWSNCPYGATPGVHPLGYGGTGAGPSVKLGGSDAGISPGGGTGKIPSSGEGSRIKRPRRLRHQLNPRISPRRPRPRRNHKTTLRRRRPRLRRRHNKKTLPRRSPETHLLRPRLRPLQSRLAAAGF